MFVFLATPRRQASEELASTNRRLEIEVRWISETDPVDELVAVFGSTSLSLFCLEKTRPEKSGRPEVDNGQLRAPWFWLKSATFSRLVEARPE